MSVVDVSGKVILITGGASGLGASMAEVLVARGARVFLGDLNEEAGQTLAGRLEGPGEADFAPVDVSDSQAVADFVAQAEERFGPVQVAINNAGIDHAPTPLADLDDETFHRNIAVNLNGVFYCMRAEIRRMLQTGGGHIINLASVAGLRSAPMLGAYAAAKHGVVGLTRTAAVEYARANIRVNAVCPSFVRTPMVEAVLEKMDESRARGLTEANPMKRLGSPEEIAYAVAWLCSDESSFMTGQSWALDGGMLA